MLAEPRSRRSYTLVPKGKPLYEDDTRFGTKLMQKMGWSKGKGLGRDESGTKDFLRVRYKNDAKGLGFEARDDQWTQHEQSFNGLLSTLNGNEEGETDNLSKTKQVSGDKSDDEAPRLGFGFQDTTSKDDFKPKAKKVAKLKEKISGVSLEEKSKTSRARVHYQKFTRGKDLAQYSEKDLANIFGKKVDEEPYNVNSQQEEQTNNDETINEESGTQFLRTGISVSDYFKMKMQEKRNRLENGSNINTADTNDYAENNSAINEVQQDEIVSKKKKKEKKSKDTENEKILDQEVPKKKEKKSKKNKNNLENENAKDKENQSANPEIVNAQEQKPKKNKKSKNKTLEHFQPEHQQIENEMEDKIKGSKRKQANVEIEDKEHTENVIGTDLTDEPQKKKLKKNKKSKDETINDEKITETDIIAEDQETSRETSEPQKKKHKKNKESKDGTISDEKITETDIIAEDHETSRETSEPQKKKHKKNKESKNGTISNEKITETEITAEDQETSIDKQEKKKTKVKELSADHQEASKVPNKKFNKNKKKDVSCNANDPLAKDANNQELKLDEIEKLYNSYNVYNISSFCAEKFRNLNFNDFNGSILSQIEGYGFSKDLQLEVHVNKNDEERITNLWKGVLDKYNRLEKPKKTYKHYVKEVIQARRMKQKRPKLYIKTWKRKNAFQVI